MPIAQQASKRFNLGTVTNNMPQMFPNLRQRLSGMKNPEVTTVQGKQGLFKKPAMISQIVGQQFNGKPDTVYVETPSYLPGVQVMPRMAGKHISPNNYSPEEANEFNTLKRRFNIAQSTASKKQQGRTMQQNDIQQQVVQLVQAAQQGDLQANQQIEQIVQAAQQGDLQAVQIAQMIQQVIEAMKQQQARAKVAKLGTKLDYIQRLKGVCPEGTEKVYLKNGGCMCQKKKENGGKLKETKKMNVVEKFKSVKKNACGTKMKK